MIPSDPCDATSTCNNSSKDSFLQTLNCAMNRQNNIDMGGNGEDTHAYTAGQEHSGIHPAGRRPAGSVQVVEGVSQAGLAAFESGWLLQCPQGKLAGFDRTIQLRSVASAKHRFVAILLLKVN